MYRRDLQLSWAHATSTNLCSSCVGLSLQMASSSASLRPRYDLAFFHSTSDFAISAKWTSLSIFWSSNCDGITASISSKDNLSILPTISPIKAWCHALFRFRSNYLHIPWSVERQILWTVTCYLLYWSDLTGGGNGLGTRLMAFHKSWSNMVMVACTRDSEQEKERR